MTHPQFYESGVEDLYIKAYSEIGRARPHLVFVSHASRAEYDRVFGPAYHTARIIPCSIRQEAFEGIDEAVVGVASPFLLTVGAVGIRKNQAAVIRAFKGADLARKGFQLVIAGSPEPGYEEVVEAARSTDGVCMIGYVSAAGLRWLYRRASGFVLASRLEGFGMPAAEALLQGAVPLVSANSALSEVAGDAAVLVDPEDECSIAEGLLTLCDMSPQARQARVSNAKSHLAAFSETATRALWRDILASVLQDPTASGGALAEPVRGPGSAWIGRDAPP